MNTLTGIPILDFLIVAIVIVGLIVLYRFAIKKGWITRAYAKQLTNDLELMMLIIDYANDELGYKFLDTPSVVAGYVIQALHFCEGTFELSGELLAEAIYMETLQIMKNNNFKYDSSLDAIIRKVAKRLTN